MKGLRGKYIASLPILCLFLSPPFLSFNPDQASLSCTMCSTWEKGKPQCVLTYFSVTIQLQINWYCVSGITFHTEEKNVGRSRVRWPEQHQSRFLFVKYVHFRLFKNMGQLKVFLPPQESAMKTVRKLLRNPWWRERTKLESLWQICFPSLQRMGYVCAGLQTWRSSCRRAQVLNICIILVFLRILLPES